MTKTQISVSYLILQIRASKSSNKEATVDVTMDSAICHPEETAHAEEEGGPPWVVVKRDGHECFRPRPALVQTLYQQQMSLAAYVLGVTRLIAKTALLNACRDSTTGNP